MILDYLQGHLHSGIIRAVVQYLKAYGYLGDVDMLNASMVKHAIMEAVRRYGGVWTELDSVITRTALVHQMINHPRCGCSDKMKLSEDRGNPWLRAGIKNIKWTLVNPLPGWTRDEQITLSKKGLENWGAVCGLQTTYVPNLQDAHVFLDLCDARNDGDGRGGMLAYTYLPDAPKPIGMYFDVAEDFRNSTKYLNVFTHEAGHVFCGLDHSSGNDAITSLMDPFYKANIAAPQPQDINRALKMWPVVPPAPTPAPSPSLPVKFRTRFSDASVKIGPQSNGIVVESESLPTIDGYTIVKKLQGMEHAETLNPDAGSPAGS